MNFEFNTTIPNSGAVIYQTPQTADSEWYEGNEGMAVDWTPAGESGASGWVAEDESDNNNWEKQDVYI